MHMLRQVQWGYGKNQNTTSKIKKELSKGLAVWKNRQWGHQGVQAKPGSPHRPHVSRAHSPNRAIDRSQIPHRGGGHGNTYLKEKVCLFSKQPVGYFQFMIISEFVYFTQKHLELVVYLFCLLNLQNQNKNSVSYEFKTQQKQA